jgi:uncharacterized membrane protein YjjP (DUF1212 family)
LEPGSIIETPGARGAGLREVRVPSLAAAVVASLAGWMVDDLVQPFLGMGFAFFLSFVVSTVVFYAARKWLIDLRGR